jgi:hypothetical protein
MKTTKWAGFVLGVTAMAASTLTAGCAARANSGSAATSSPASTSTEQAGYHINVLQNGRQTGSLSLAQLKTLPTVTFNAYQRTETGPTLLSALKLAGIDSFARITVSGMLRGRVATGELSLNRNDITDEVILDFSNEGKAKLAGSKIPFDNWIIDVSEVRVE